MAQPKDKKTLALIKQLKARNKAGHCNEVDKMWLRDLMTGEKVLGDIKLEKDRCRGD
jgi:hypothetical protein